MATIDQFKANLIGGGPRANRFRVFVPRAGQRLEFLCTATKIPESTINTISVPFRGQQLKLAGDRTFADWTTTVINDSNHTIREALEDLQREYGVTDYNSETSKTRTGGTATEFSTILVEQLNQAGEVVYSYTLENCWPQDISTIDLSYDSTDTLEEFTVTWSDDYFTFE